MLATKRSCHLAVMATTAVIACLVAVGQSQSQLVIDRATTRGGWSGAGNWVGSNVPDNNPTPESARFAIDATYSLLSLVDNVPFTIEDLLVVAGDVEIVASDGIIPTPREFTINQTFSVDNSSFNLIGDTHAPFNFLVKGQLVITATGELGFSHGMLVVEQGVDNSSGGTLDLNRMPTGVMVRDTTLRLTGGASTLSLPGQPFSLAGFSLVKLEVDGVGTTAAVGDLKIDGVRGDGSGIGAGMLRVASGAQLTSSAADVSQSAGGAFGVTQDVVVSGAQSRWINSGLLQVGTLSTTEVLVEGGGSIDTGSLEIARDAGDMGLITLMDAGSSLTAGNLYVGGGASGGGGTGELFIGAQAEAVVTNELTVYSGGTIVIDGGSLTTDTISNSAGGLLDFRSGRLQVNSGLTIGEAPGPGVLLPGDLEVAVNRTYATTGTTTILPGRLLTLEDGKFVTGSLDIQGNFLWRSGTLGLTGGTIAGLNHLIVPVNGTLEASGTTIIPLTAVAGSAITLDGDATLGDPAALNGAFVESTVTVGQHTLTLQDANDVVFDSGTLVTLGESGAAGGVVAANGLTLDFGANIAGHGTVDTPNDPAKPTINNGAITGTSLAEPVTLAGYVKGVGTCDNCLITGTDAPGFSPATVNRGSVTYAGTLQIEVGGTTPGGDFDRLNHILGAGIADLGGTLDVQLINGFQPQSGQAFTFLAANGSIEGQFDEEVLPELGGGLFLAVGYGAKEVTLSVEGVPGDYNYDGMVNIADYTIWRDSLGAIGSGLDADGNGNQIVDEFDYQVWRTNFGNTAAALSPSGMAVPEPGALTLLVLFSLAITCRCRMASPPAHLVPGRALSILILFAGSITYCEAIAQPLDPLAFASLGTLNLPEGNYTIDTDLLTIYDNLAPGVPLFTGVVDDQNGQADYFGGVWDPVANPGQLGIPEIAVFTFDDIDLQPTASVTITGTRAIALLSHGDATIGTPLSVDGQSVGFGIPSAATPGGAGGAGGFAGGPVTAPTPGGGLPGLGPGGGIPAMPAPGQTAFVNGGNAGFGGRGVDSEAFSSNPELSAIGGPAYGDLGVALQSGSGGASLQNGNEWTGGGGGGALELVATQTLTISAPITARGGGGGDLLGPFGNGGAGSGGGIRLSGDTVVLDALVLAGGGQPETLSTAGISPSDPVYGGGGRIYVDGLVDFVPLIPAELGTLVAQATVDIEASNENLVDQVQAGSVPWFTAESFGVVTLVAKTAVVPAGTTHKLGERVDISSALKTVEVVTRRVVIEDRATAVIPIEGFTNRFGLELLGTQAVINGAGLLTNEKQLSGTGRVEVPVTNAAGATIDAVNDTLAFSQSVTNASGAQVNAINSTLSFDGGLDSDGQINLINSTVNGDVVNNGVVSLAGTNTFTGTVSGNGAFTGTGTGVFSGTLAPGASPGVLTFEGDLVLEESVTLAIEIGDATAGTEFDRLVVDGQATLGGLLYVALLGDYTPAVGEQFALLTAGNIVDNGLALTGAAAGQFSLLVDETSVVLQLESLSTGLDGDYNNDGMVNLADYTVWRDNLGAPEGTLDNDPNPGAIGVAQYTTWKANFGASVLATAELSANVPEPGALVLLCQGGLLALLRCYRTYFLNA